MVFFDGFFGGRFVHGNAPICNAPFWDRYIFCLYMIWSNIGAPYDGRDLWFVVKILNYYEFLFESDYSPTPFFSNWIQKKRNTLNYPMKNILFVAGGGGLRNSIISVDIFHKFHKYN